MTRKATYLYPFLSRKDLHQHIAQTLERLHKVASETYVKHQGQFSSPDLESVVVVEERESNMISPP